MSAGGAMAEAGELSLLYRGSLASCNYHCPYCPLRHRRDTRAELRADERALERFLTWVADHRQWRTGVLITPWGEALTRPWYREALIRLSRLEHVSRAVAQTNLSVPPYWVAEADPTRLALWCTYHPGQTTGDRFLAACGVLLDHKIRFSVGVVGLREHLAAARALRAALPERVYVWINAEEGRPYSPEEEAEWTEIDPWFGFSARPHRGLGASCRTGETVFSVLADGTVRRCHFVPGAVGNLYQGWLPGQGGPPGGCPNQWCDCHIGYVHLRRLRLYELFGEGVLERCPPGP